VSAGLSSAEVDEVYRRYGFFLRRRCRILLRDASLAEDALQEVFVKVMRAGADLKKADHPMRWLHRVTDRACFDQLRRGKRIRAARPLHEIDELVHPGCEPDVRRAVIEVLAQMEEEEQQIAVMAFVDGMSQEEIARELGYSRVTVNKRVARIRERAAEVCG
jgi:RNA polymerase sigma-70 factor (ECF subfamily)